VIKTIWHCQEKLAYSRCRSGSPNYGPRAVAQPEWGRRGHGPPRNQLAKIFLRCFISISTVRK